MTSAMRRPEVLGFHRVQLKYSFLFILVETKLKHIMKLQGWQNLGIPDFVKSNQHSITGLIKTFARLRKCRLIVQIPAVAKPQIWTFDK